MLSSLKVYLKLAWALKTPFVLPLDLRYKAVTTPILNQIIDTIVTSFSYTREFSDCDDAAWRFKGEASRIRENGVGFVIGWARWAMTAHCWNVLLMPDGIYQIEPQNGQVFEKDKQYRAWGVII